MKKSILTLALGFGFTAFSPYINASDSDFNLMNQLLSENHELKSKVNDIETKYRAKLIESEKFNGQLESKDSIINSLMEKNRHLLSENQDLLSRDKVYKDLIQQAKQMIEYSTIIGKSISGLEGVRYSPPVINSPPPEPSYSRATHETNNRVEEQEASKPIPPKSNGGDNLYLGGKSVVKFEEPVAGMFLNNIGNIRDKPTTSGSTVLRKSKKDEIVFLSHKTTGEDWYWYKIKGKNEWVSRSIVVVNE